MARTQPTGKQIADNSIQRDDLDVSTVGQAVARKLVEGTGINLSSTGADAGTGDVTIDTEALTLGTTSMHLGDTVPVLQGLTDPTSPQDSATKNYVDAAIAALTQGTGTGVLTGCGVVWTGGLNFTVSAGTYSINGTTYSVAQTNLTLGAADATFDRIDIIAVNISSAAVVIAGTPAASPLAPTVDPSTQLQLTFVYVAANASTPSNITSTTLYAENAGSPTEWTSSSSGSTWSLASTTNPHGGTKDIEATSLGGGAYVQLQKPSSTIDLSTQNNLVFYIRSKAAWNANRSLTIAFFNAGVQVGNAYSFKEGSFGFVSSNTSGYQQITIPISTFNVGSTVVNQIRFIAAGSGGSAIGFYLDDITLQAGVSITSQNFMVWRGTWSSSTAYIKNDVVTYQGVSYVCQVANTNSVPTITNTNWQSEGSTVESIGAVWGGLGSVVPTGKAAGYYVIPFSGKITGWNISVDTGTCTIKVWKIATGTAVPTSSNSINTSGVAISTGTSIRSSTVSDFTTTAVAAGDIFAFQLTGVSGATEITFGLEITRQ